MRFFEAVLQVVRKSFVFKGRARRKEYWSWVVFKVLLSIILSVVCIGLVHSVSSSTRWMPVLISFFSLAIFFPNISVTFRRLHDIGCSGWWYSGFYLALLVACGLILKVATNSLGLIKINVIKSEVFFWLIYLLLSVVFVYSIVMLIWLFTEGIVGPNKYGDDPKRVKSDFVQKDCNPLFTNIDG